MSSISICSILQTSKYFVKIIKYMFFVLLLYCKNDYISFMNFWLSLSLLFAFFVWYAGLEGTGRVSDEHELILA